MSIICRVTRLITDIRGPGAPLPRLLRAHADHCPRCAADRAAAAAMAELLGDYADLAEPSRVEWDQIRAGLEPRAAAAPAGRVPRAALAGAMALLLIGIAAAIGYRELARCTPAAPVPAKMPIAAAPRSGESVERDQPKSQPAPKVKQQAPQVQPPSAKPATKPTAPRRRLTLPPRKVWYAANPDRHKAPKPEVAPKAAPAEAIVAAIPSEELIIDVVDVTAARSDDTGYVIERVSVDTDTDKPGVMY